MTVFRCLAVLSTMLWLAQCTDTPDLGAAIPAWVDAAPYPDLVPLDRALADLPDPETAGTEITTELEARAARLRERAQQLQAPVVDDTARQRMNSGIAL